MSKADELLNSLSDDDISLQLANPDTEPHIVIGGDRFVSVPKELQRIAVQYDHDVETVTFDCPRYWDGLDMSKLYIYINYRRKDRVVGCYKATNVTVDETDSTIMHFDWTISRNVSLVNGELKFLVCIRKADDEGNEENHWNSELNTEMYVSEGLETGEAVVEPYPDIISQWEEDVQRVKDILLKARDDGEFDGATFTPSVDEDGNLSWTNDRGRENPKTVNIHGYSPAILVKEVDGGKQLIITDYRQSQTVTIQDGYSPVILVREVEGGKDLIITDKKQSQTVTIKDGVDGYSPVILVREVEGGRELVITDKKQSQTVKILDGTNGTNGTDGYSPAILVRDVTGGHQLVITDYRQSQTVDVMDGKDGTNGTNGTDGYSPTVTTEAITGGTCVTVTDKDGAKSFDILNGTDGTNGTNGTDGKDGYSPAILVRDVDGGHQLVITDYRQSQTVDVMNGTNGTDGTDGYSPTVAITDLNNGHRVTITDKDGAKTFDVMNGTIEASEDVVNYMNNYIHVGDVEPTSGPVLWFDTSATGVN